MIQHHPCPTIYPYTTLFRSRLYQLAAGERWDPLVPEPPPDAPDERVVLDDPEDDVERLTFSIKAAADRLLARLAERRRDRKSTRLNFSHPSTSYAVFSLKKKSSSSMSASAARTGNGASWSLGHC